MDTPESSIPMEENDSGIIATRGLVEGMRAAGLLSRDAYQEAVAKVHPPREWGVWASRMFEGVGAAIFLAGVVFFFAFNWARMGSFLKLGMIESGLIVCAATAAWRGFDSFAGKTLALAASMFVGVFLAVMGQIYQTGADSWQLFAAWAAIILAWTALARFPALWALWMVVANLAISLYLTQTANVGANNDSLLFIVMAVFNGASLCVAEARSLNIKTFPGWFRISLLATTLLFVNLPILDIIIEMHFDTNDSSLLSLCKIVLLFVVTPASFYFYMRKAPDIIALGLVVFSVCALVLTLVGRFLLELLNNDISTLIIFFLLMAVAVLGVFSRASQWLYQESIRMKQAYAKARGKI